MNIFNYFLHSHALCGALFLCLSINICAAETEPNLSPSSIELFLSEDDSPIIFYGIPEDLVMECGDPIPAPPTVTAQGPCGPVTSLTYTETIIPLSYGGLDIKREWKAIDDCNGSTIEESYIQNILTVDMTPPVLTIPADQILVCGSVVPAASATAIDACQGVLTYSVTETSTSLCGNSLEIVRVYTATDAVGNMSTATETITLIDNVAPVITASSGTVIECGQPIPPPNAVVTDNCDAAPNLTISESFGPDCGNTGVIERYYMAVDACGNSTLAIEEITIVDTTPPAIASISPLYVEGDSNCQALLPNYSNLPIVTELCGSYTVVQSPAPGTLISGSVMVYWYVTDDCGNTDYRETLVHVHCIAAMSYSSDTFCIGDENPWPEIDEEIEGLFYSSPEGLMIDEETGMILLEESEPGAFTILFEPFGGEFELSYFELTIIEEGGRGCERRGRDSDRVFLETPSFIVYPNPSDGEIINLKFNNLKDDSSTLGLEIVDLRGGIVNSQRYVLDQASDTQLILDVSNLEPGVYLARVRVGTRVMESRLLIR